MALSRQTNVDSYRIGDIIKIAVHTEYGIITIEFKILYIFGNVEQDLLLISQDRIVKAHIIDNKNILLSTPIDLHQYDILERVHKIVK